MPSLLIHLRVAYELKDKLLVENLPQFYLGTIAPDTVNLNGFAEKPIRWKAHLRDKNLDQWEQNISEFYQRQQKKQPKDYLLGYYVHILTDIVFDRANAPLYEKDPNRKQVKQQCREQTRKYENSQIKESWWQETVIQLEKGKPYEINDIPENDILKWREKILTEYKERQVEKWDKIDPEYMNKRTDEVMEILKKNQVK